MAHFLASKYRSSLTVAMPNAVRAFSGGTSAALPSPKPMKPLQ